MDKIIIGDALVELKKLPDNIVQMICTSPPYWGLRDYGTATWEGGVASCDHKTGFVASASTLEGGKSTIENAGSFYRDTCRKCGAIRIDQQLGLEKTPEIYVEKMVEIFREVRRILKPDGVIFLNLGDSYAGSGSPGGDFRNGKGGDTYLRPYNRKGFGLKPKDRCMIPARVALGLQADGYWLRDEIIWCLSGGTYIYAKTATTVAPMMIRDIARLKPGTVQLWNGHQWTQLLGISKSKRKGNELEIVLRSGERISCTPTHKFPTDRGLMESGNLRVGDILQSSRLPDTQFENHSIIDNDAAWLAGLYIAEGSRSTGGGHNCIQIAGHSKESERWSRLQRIAAKFGGSATRTVDGNNMSIRLYGKILNALIDELVSGRVAKDKGFSPKVWRYGNLFIQSMLEGYLSGDGYWDKNNQRWRLGFTRNYNLERDIRTACARLGYRLVLKLASQEYEGRQVPTFRGEIRTVESGHLNRKHPNEIVEIRKARCRELYDIGVADEPHLFALASGILTHNSKPNPMPESVTDRCTKSHEMIYMLSKSSRYYYDNIAIAETSVDPESTTTGRRKRNPDAINKSTSAPMAYRNFHSIEKNKLYPTKNRRSVWTINTESYSEAHFAVFPLDIPMLCIQAGSRKGDLVCDPFLGSGTVAQAAKQLGRHYLGIELQEKFLPLINRRLSQGALGL